MIGNVHPNVHNVHFSTTYKAPRTGGASRRQNGLSFRSFDSASTPTSKIGSLGTPVALRSGFCLQAQTPTKRLKADPSATLGISAAGLPLRSRPAKTPQVNMDQGE